MSSGTNGSSEISFDKQCIIFITALYNSLSQMNFCLLPFLVCTSHRGIHLSDLYVWQSHGQIHVMQRFLYAMLAGLSKEKTENNRERCKE